MSSLAQLQRELQQHVLMQDLAIVPNILASAAIPAATRLQIYSDAYRLRLIDALESNYPVLAQTLGAQNFARLAQRYLANFPSQHFSIRWFGHRLVEFVRDDAEYAEQRWLRELATWEWATTSAFDAADVQSLTIADIANISPDDWPLLQFAAHPSLQRIRLQSNVVALVKASVANEVAPQPQTLDNGAEWCLWREDLTVRYRSLESAEASAIDVLLAGGNFDAMCTTLADFIDAEQVPLHAASLLKTWIDEQWLTRVWC